MQKFAWCLSFVFWQIKTIYISPFSGKYLFLQGEIHLHISAGKFYQPFSYCCFLCAFNLAEYFLNKSKNYLQLAGDIFRHCLKISSSIEILIFNLFNLKISKLDFRKQSPSCSVKKVLLKTSKKSQENTRVGVPYLIKLPAFIKKETPAQGFFKNNFFIEHLQCLLQNFV